MAALDSDMAHTDVQTRGEDIGASFPTKRSILTCMYHIWTTWTLSNCERATVRPGGAADPRAAVRPIALLQDVLLHSSTLTKREYMSFTSTHTLGPSVMLFVSLPKMATVAFGWLASSACPWSWRLQTPPSLDLAPSPVQLQSPLLVVSPFGSRDGGPFANVTAAPPPPPPPAGLLAASPSAQRAMASPFVPAQFTVWTFPPGGGLKQSTPLHQHHNAQSNQCDEAAPSANYPSAGSWLSQAKQSDSKQGFSNGPERDVDANAIRRLQEENRELQARLAEMNHSHQLQVCSLQRQLEEAKAAYQAAEQRLVAMATPTPAPWASATTNTASTTSWPTHTPSYQPQPLVSSTYMPPQMLNQRQPQTFAPQQQQPQQRRFHPYARQYQQQQQPQQQQVMPAPPCNAQTPPMLPRATPPVTPQAPPADKQATGGLFAYCTGLISASLPSSTAGSSVMPATGSSGLKAAPSWKLFGRSRATEDDEETGRVAPLLPHQTQPTGMGGALRDPTV